jgi:hypothetical protein
MTLKSRSRITYSLFKKSILISPAILNSEMESLPLKTYRVILHSSIKRFKGTKALIMLLILEML